MPTIFICCVFFLLPSLIIEANSASLFGIVEPYPENIYPLEFTSAQVTCVAFDAAGIKVPKKILFMRRDEFNRYVELKPNDNLHFDNRTEMKDNKPMLFVTMHIRNVSVDDDSLYGALGNYECHAFGVGDVNERARHGFSVSVITRAEIPKVVVPDITADTSVLQHGDDVTLICNLTERGNKASTPLKRISWFKDGVLVESVRNPDPQDPRYMLSPLKMKDVSVRDGGNYTCLLQVRLRNVKEYNVSDHTVVHIAPWFEHKGEKEIIKKTGEGVKLECSAKGFPLNVEWKFKSSEIFVSCIGLNASNERYNITRKGVYDPYYLAVSDLVTTDTGSYYCCLPSNCSANVDEDRCQRFVLTVEDPKGGTMALASHGVLVVLSLLLASFLLL